MLHQRRGVEPHGFVEQVSAIIACIASVHGSCTVVRVPRYSLFGVFGHCVRCMVRLFVFVLICGCTWFAAHAGGALPWLLFAALVSFVSHPPPF